MFYHHKYWVVELDEDFDISVLPGKFGGRGVRYINSITSPNVADDTDYRLHGLSLGVRVSGHKMSSRPE